jgi:hypothetical protein
MYSSAVAGFRTLEPSVDAVFLLPVDIALVRAATVRRMVSAGREAPGRLLYPWFRGLRGHPPLVPADLVAGLPSTPSEGGMRSLLAAAEHRAVDVPVADSHILFDMDRPEDLEEMQRRFPRLGIPSRSECDALMALFFPEGGKVVRHGLKVRQVAVKLCRALNRVGESFDEERVEAAAFLHDIARGEADHALAGARRLRSLGFAAVAGLVASHTDLPAEEIAAPGEAALVYLADKLVKEDGLVPLEQRFAAALERFRDDPAACRAVRRRRDAALAVRARLETRLQAPLASVLSGVAEEEGGAG